tara:strand:- start:742 stop:975 length:234 start_codon:yes stop_codon:yes gene_type:complete
MAARPPSLQDLARRKAKGPFKFPKFLPVSGPVEEQFGFMAERDGIVLPGPMILSTEDGDIIFGNILSVVTNPQDFNS